MYVVCDNNRKLADSFRYPGSSSDVLFAFLRFNPGCTSLNVYLDAPGRGKPADFVYVSTFNKKQISSFLSKVNQRL